MKKQVISVLVAGCLSLVLFGVVPAAHAAMININFNDGQAEAPIHDFYSSFGITFVNAKWSTSFTEPRPGVSAPLILSSISDDSQMKETNPILGIFTSSVNSITISAIDVGYNDARIDAYDAAGNLVGFDFYEGLSPIGNTMTPQDTSVLSVSGAGIVCFELYQPMSVEARDGLGWDNLSFKPVPVPATILLFGTGIAGLAGTRLRRKKK